MVRVILASFFFAEMNTDSKVGMRDAGTRFSNMERMERMTKENASYARALFGVTNKSEIGYVDERTGDMVWLAGAPPREICFSQYIALRDSESASRQYEYDIPRDGDVLLEILFGNAAAAEVILEVYSPSILDGDVVVSRHACPPRNTILFPFGNSGLNMAQLYLDRATYRIRFLRPDGSPDDRDHALGFVIATYAVLSGELRRKHMKCARLCEDAPQKAECLQ